MTLDELTDECWKSLPAIRKRLVGRAAVKVVVIDSLREIDPGRLDKFSSEGEIENYENEVLERIKRSDTFYSSDDKDGFAILSFLLITIAAAVISWLIQRWLDNRFPKDQLEALRQEVLQS